MVKFRVETFQTSNIHLISLLSFTVLESYDPKTD